MHAYCPHNSPSFLSSLLAILLMSITPAIFASDRWDYQTMDGVLYAIPPSNAFTLHMPAKPNDYKWAILEIPLTEALLPELHKKRKSPNFPFIDVGVEVDNYYRTAQSRILDDELKLSIEIDHRMWSHFKRGGKLEIDLPNGTRFEETLSGSNAALRKLEANKGY